ncbi:hypothetical protein RHSIM_Rhsim10G0142900 [Rhododendron simsii]|uniref:Uncharacterized protein n=1 Tax=Rhododendron simsii TaxID=118357 RepID=A0A834L9M9_RHOSS|nr:hypothetical protein RHSIM_Rhsim10G0142900 [Rhododendron simsii]
MKRNNDSQFNLDLTIKPQLSKALKRSESLEDKPLNNWFEVLVGEFVLSAQYVGYMEFSLGQYDGDFVACPKLVSGVPYYGTQTSWDIQLQPEFETSK